MPMPIPAHVLIVEDSEDDLLLLLHTLRRGGYAPDYVCVQTAAEFTAALESGAWDLVISDFSLPQFSGIAALKLLKDSGRDLPFIMVSGAIGEETAVAVMRAGAQDYVMKGNLTRLTSVVERELREVAERTARRQAEEQVYLLSNALMQSTTMVAILNTDGTISYANEAFVRGSGYALAELIGQHAARLSLNTLSKQLLRGVNAGLRGAGEWHGEVLSRRRDGESFWIAVKLSVIRDGGGRSIGLLLVADDISERKSLEMQLERHAQQLEQMVETRTAELRQAKEQIEVILSNTSDAIALADADGNLVQLNPAFAHLFGSRVSVSIEQILGIMRQEDKVTELAQALLKVIYDHAHARVDTDLEVQNGAVIDADLMLAPVVAADADRAGLVVSVRDISHIKALDRFKTRFVANVAHDLSNPISVVRGRLYLLKAIPEKTAENMAILEREVDRLEQFVDELRTLAELDRGEIVLDLEDVRLNDLLREIVEAHRPIAEQHQQILALSVADGLPVVRVDRRKCERVIVNLLANALNYTPEGGEIRIVLRQGSSGIAMIVEDTGMGIAPEDLPHIFERFYRSATAKRASETGTGLGLAIVKEMVEAHGGSVHVESVLNAGSRFVVTLPLTSVAAQSPMFGS